MLRLKVSTSRKDRGIGGIWLSTSEVYRKSVAILAPHGGRPPHLTYIPTTIQQILAKKKCTRLPLLQESGVNPEQRQRVVANVSTTSIQVAQTDVDPIMGKTP
jgi:hypothetical protein